MGFAGFGGGGTGLALGGSSAPTIEATGGFIGEYTDAPTGDVYRTHTFTASGSFVVTDVKGDGEMEYLVVGGGGAGGMGRHDASTASPQGGYHVWSSGGGGGGVRTNVPGTPISADNPITAVTGTYYITVGMGGMMGAGHTKTAWGRRGHDSRFSNPATPLDIIADGGGGGLGKGSEPPTSQKTGGSGGGGGQEHPTASSTPYTSYPGGAGNTPPYSPPQGNAGGDSFRTSTPPVANIGLGAGGGGAGGAGGGGGPDCGGGDGIGLTIEDGSTTVYYGGGGAGGSNPDPNPNAFGGKCGPEPPSTSYQYTTSSYDLGFGSGGRGEYNAPTGNIIDMVTRSGKQGVQGYGGGGGGTSDYGSGAVGGWGCVVIRYKIAEQTGTAKATGGIINYYPTSPLSPTGAVIHIFRGPGNFVTPPTFNETCEYVVVGGGGCGGTRGGGGGGAGGFVTATTPIGGGQDCGVYVGQGGAGRDPGYQWAGSGPTGTDYVSAGIGQGTNSFAAFPAGTVTAGGGGAGGGDMREPTPSGYNPYAVMPNPVASGGGGSPTGTTGATGGPQGNNGGDASGTAYGGGGGGAGGAGTSGYSHPTISYGGRGGSGVQLPATFRNPTMATPAGTEYNAGGGLGYPGPGPTGVFMFAGGGGGGSAKTLPGTAYGSFGGGPTASVQNSKVPFDNSLFRTFGWTGAGSGRGPSDVAYVPAPTYGLGENNGPWTGGYGGPAGANSGSGGGAAAAEGISSGAPSYTPSEPIGGTGGSGIVLIAYPQ